MMTKLSWSVLILAALAVVACWNPEGQPACNESRPVFGATACCARHRVAGTATLTTAAYLGSRLGTEKIAR
jgi:hypothetical protein